MKKFLLLTIFIYFFLIFTKPVFGAEKTYNFTLLNNIVPGNSTEENVLSLLGKPTKDFYSLQKDIFWYYDQDNAVFQTVIFRNQIVDLITIHIPQDQTENLKNYGLWDHETYNYYSLDTKTYIYGKLGLALTADTTGKIFVKQKFVPGTYVDFLNKWGKEFPDTNPYNEGFKETSPSAIPQAKIANQSPLELIYNFFLDLSQKIKSFFKIK